MATDNTGFSTNDYAPQLLRFGLTGLAVGGGARLLKHVLDVTRNRDIRTPLTGRHIRPAVSPVDVQVTPEEADELRQQGVEIGSQTPKIAEGTGFTGDFFRNAGLGLAATGGLAAGWVGGDMLAEAGRKSLAKRKLDAQRARVEALLDGEGRPEDAKLAGFMAAGEDAMVEGKLASVIANNLLDMGLNNSLISPLGYVAGPAALAAIVSSYRKARESSRDEQDAKQVARQYSSATEPQTPILSLRPVL